MEVGGKVGSDTEESSCTAPYGQYGQDKGLVQRGKAWKTGME